MEKNNDNFKSRLGVVAATAGSAVGLGNIWAFPYKAGANGGGTFVLIYLFCVLFIGVPLMLSEFIIGREGKGGPVGSIEAIAGKRSPFLIGGYIGSLCTFIILSFYSVVAGWSISYLVKTIPQGFSSFASQDASNKLFGSLAVTSVVPNMVTQSIFMALTILIVVFGIKNGIERLSKLMMPLLLVIILIIDIYSMTLPNNGFMKAVDFLFVPHGINDGANIFHVAATAMGHAFFTLSLGMGAIITYARAVKDDVSINVVTAQVCIADTVVALLAGLATFPIIFSQGLDMKTITGGSGIAFRNLPVAFAQMPGGYIIGNLFFLLLLIAALTSSISMLENTLTTVMEKIGLHRKVGAIVLGIVILLFGFLSQLGTGISAPFLDFVHTSAKLGNEDLLDQLNLLTTNFLIPIGALFITILIGYRMKPEVIRRQINNEKIANIFIPYIRYVAPVLVGLVFLSSVFWGVNN